eukprot:CAMPEP_0176479800 /NCGR_PEP_ID=MMETSP0200_2-20121128/1936_1 /TAXON_ID=947934 /ORGANISM="Chaetoceros sp., Strain GSL56" /LENGTH=367 /DNA_ID=CAMNT_0017875875 /DNA_START=593 /DNA_END=1693 /DNA_ORIENTATION=-
MYNPANSTFAWCAGLPYPEECAYDKSIECIRGSANAMVVLRQGLVVLIVFDFSLILVTMVLVIVKAIQTNRVIEMVYKQLKGRSDSPRWHQEMNVRHHLVARQNNVKATIVHALSYILAFLTVLIIPLLISVDTFENPFENPLDMDESQWEKRFRVDKAMLVLLPMQGVFNFFIFISLKIYSYRKTYTGASIFQTFRKVFLERIQEPCYISRISIVNHDRENDGAVLDENICGNYHVDIDLTKDQNKEENVAGVVIGDDEKKIFVLSMSDESGNSDLQYRIMLFASGVPHASNNMTVGHENSPDYITSKEVGNNNESVDIEMDKDEEYNSDDYASLPRVSNSMKSDGTIKAEEQRKKFIDDLFHQSS